MEDKIRDTKTLTCIDCKHQYTYDEWAVEDNCPFCKSQEGWEIMPRELDKEL